MLKWNKYKQLTAEKKDEYRYRFIDSKPPEPSYTAVLHAVRGAFFFWIIFMCLFLMAFNIESFHNIQAEAIKMFTTGTIVLFLFVALGGVSVLWGLVRQFMHWRRERSWVSENLVS